MTNSPWCDTCHRRIVPKFNGTTHIGWVHVDTTQGWKRISLDHPPTGKGWDQGHRPPKGTTL